MNPNWCFILIRIRLFQVQLKPNFSIKLISKFFTGQAEAPHSRPQCTGTHPLHVDHPVFVGWCVSWPAQRDAGSGFQGRFSAVDQRSQRTLAELFDVKGDGTVDVSGWCVDGFKVRHGYWFCKFNTAWEQDRDMFREWNRKQWVLRYCTEMFTLVQGRVRNQ